MGKFLFFPSLNNFSSAHCHYSRCAAYKSGQDFAKQNTESDAVTTCEARTTTKYLRILRKQYYCYLYFPTFPLEKSKMRIIGTHSSHPCCPIIRSTVTFGFSVAKQNKNSRVDLSVLVLVNIHGLFLLIQRLQNIFTKTYPPYKTKSLAIARLHIISSILKCPLKTE